MNAQDYEIRIWWSPKPGDECFVAQAVDMPGVMAHGDTREEAAREIQAALELALESYREHGEEPPAPGRAAAATLGRLGGASSSWKKALASRRNGKKGGRPKKGAKTIAR